MIRPETIAAISTAPGSAGIGIIRISGDKAINIINKIFRFSTEGQKISRKERSFYFGTIVSGKEVIDEALVLVMPAPHSYTRENVVEIDCHGGLYVTGKVLEAVIGAGARLAEPGEFTRRAFENGRIDLSQAEAVIDVINAENDFALKSAVSQLKGSLSSKIRGLRGMILEQTAFIEAALDDPEHYNLEDYGGRLLAVMEECRDQINLLISSSDDGRILKEGIKTAILGRPNVGKSTFMNALLEEDRAIVTEIAGTTRDVLEESIRLKDVVLRLADTAGIRKTEDIIEKTGVEKARKYAKEADLIVFIADASARLTPEDLEILDFIKDKKKIVLLNKADLGINIDLDEIRKRLNCPVIECALLKRKGLLEFAEAVQEMFYSGRIASNNQIYVTNIRQKEALVRAADSLDKVCESIRSDMPEDFFTIDLMDAYISLGEIIGETIEDDLADEIFSKFCMGK